MLEQRICTTEITVHLPSYTSTFNAEDSRLSLWGLNSPLSPDQWQLVERYWQLVERYWQLVERGLVEREVLHWQLVERAST